VWVTDDQFLLVIWNTLYTSRYLEPTKLGFLNWEPTPRTYLFGAYSLSTTDLFEQRMHDAIVAFTNLQNYGVVNWDANTVGKVNPMVRENIILAQKKIAPYKNHIENQTLVFVDISTDGGRTWTEGGYPNAPFQQRYNGWWMADRLYKDNAPFPMIMASYNATQRTFLVSHLTGNLPTGNFSFKIRFKVPNTSTTHTFDISSNRQLNYSFFQL
jgi:hypothetical protein